MLYEGRQRLTVPSQCIQETPVDDLGAGRAPLGQGRELVAFRSGEHDPGCSPTDARPAGTQRQQPVHPGGLVIRAEVRVQTALGYSPVACGHEEQT